ncbi:hypothetical protein F4677DRAFT_411969 [Hypoxylon crocopeplum]|nr:hypothetical protein F4677DRAFT_411969 [Hypoxylon crocopeplum]
MNNSQFKESASYLARLERFHQLDEERENMIKDLVTKYEDLEQRFEKKCEEYENETQTRSLYQARANESDRKLIDIQHKMEVNSFAFAIVDGDGAVFRDDWIAKGEEGGAMAAHQLRTDIKKHLKSVYPDINVEPWQVIVQVVLNLEGLSRKLYSVDLTKTVNELPAFARGFSRAQGLFSIVDVGKGKEQADFKVREMLRVMISNLQCKHIIFGPCHDKGYIVELRPYQLETSMSTKLTLLETTTAPREFQELTFRRVRFTEVFRSEPLPDGPPTTASVVSPTKPAKYSIVASTWSRAIPFVGESETSTATEEKTAEPSPRQYYLVNSSGERVDEQIPQFDAASETSFRDRCGKETRGPCNKFHLNGICKEYSCTYFHGKRFSPGEQLVQRTKARGSFCFSGGSCNNFECFWGHHCKYGQKCKRYGCIFASTHDMDLKPAEKIYEDGSREIIT